MIACSRLQEATWLAEQAADVGAANTVTLALGFDGPIDLEALRDALAAVVRAHPGLRTRFGVAAERLVRTEREEATAPELALEMADGDLGELIAARSRIPLDLLAAPYTLWLLRQPDGRHVLVGAFHHATFDGLSAELFASDLVAAYGRARAGAPAALPLRASYGAYVEHEVERIQALAGKAGRYWTPILDGLHDVVPLRASPHADARGAGRGEATCFRIEGRVRRALERLAQRSGVSLFVTLVAAVHVLLHVYAAREDGRVATLVPMDARPPGLRDAIGMFANEAPLVTEPEAGMSFAAFLAQVAERTRALVGLRAFPFTEALARFGPATDPLALLPRVGVGYWKASTAPSRAETLLPAYGQRWSARFRFRDGPSALQGVLEYDSEALHGVAAERMVAQLQTLLGQIATRPGARLADLDVLPAAERRTLAAEWNATETPRSRRTAPELFEAQVRRSPDRPAARAGERVSYRRLDRRANRLAHELIGAGAGPGAIVALCLPRGIDLLVALIAVLKSGAAYLPLEPRHPRARIEHMLRDSGAAILLTTSDTDPEVDAAPGPRTMRLDAMAQRLARSPDRAPRARATPSDRCFVIYTSGSTGRPKGVEISHDALSNFLQATACEPGLGSTDVLVAVASVAFDLATLELLLPLVVGAEVVIASSGDTVDGDALRRLLERSGATYLHATPATWRLLLGAGLPFIRTAVSGGETLPPGLARALAERSEQSWNSYGPTETTIGSTVHRIDDPDRIAIGRPLANTRVYVVDRAGRLAPTGVAGELWIGGDGVAIGYLGRPELTRRQFVADPFTPGAGRVYRTGDLVRQRDDGALEYLGRIDDQIKLRGHRIEPAEIESVLLEHAAVREAVILHRGDGGGARLVAYIVPERGEGPSTAALRAHCARRLPEVMVPAAFVRLDRLPLTRSGKVDRAALPDAGDARPDAALVAPRTDLEAALAAIWAQVLRVERVGVRDDFFALGGHSLLAAEVVGRAREEVDPGVSLRLLFAAPTVEGMAAALAGGDRWAEHVPRARRSRLEG